jgi:hypothetical protein
VSITPPAPNNPPVAVDDAYSVEENTTLNVAAPGVLANDSDADGDPLTAALVDDVSNGSLTLNADGSFSYTPALDYNGSDSFTYKANDGTDDSNIATVSITVTEPPPPGQTATFGLDSGNHTWGESANFICSMKFTCPDDGTLTKIALLVDDASPTGNAKVAIYDHDAANNLPQNLLWGGSSTPVDDGWMEWATSPVQLSADTVYWLAFWLDAGNGIRYQSGSGRDVWWNLPYGEWPGSFGNSPAGANNNQNVLQATYVIEEGGNNPPVAVDDAYSVEENTTLNVAAPGVLANDSDANGDPLAAMPVRPVIDLPYDLEFVESLRSSSFPWSQ